MTQQFDPTTHSSNAGQRLVTLDDFQRLPYGSVMLNFGRPGNIEEYPEVFQKYNRNYWNLPGDDMTQRPYSDEQLAELVTKFGTIYICVWRAPDRDDS